MGSSVPRAVVVSAMATGTNARTRPTAYSRPTTPAGQRGRHQPRQGGAAPEVRAQQPLVDLVAGQEEQEPEPDVREDLHVLGRPEPQTLRPDQHPAQEEQDDLRNPRAGQQGEADGGQHRDDGDHEQRAERGMHVHRECPP